jgi:pimeloyl-ACP methyl ester carboxylesterase
MNAQTDFKRGSVRAGALEFHYLEAGSGPLALCLHGFPDSPWTFRYLLPQLAQAGYRAVAPYMRGYAPTEIPLDGDFSIKALASDANALHEALGGDSNAVLIAHDWGAITAWGALAAGPTRWRRAVVASIPPFGCIKFAYKQIKRSFYFWFFQMAAADGMVSANNMAFIDGLWGDWSPGYDATYDLTKAKECLSRPENLKAALGYYRDYCAPSRFRSPNWVEQQVATWGRPIPQTVLYLHGVKDGCTALEAVAMDTLPKHLGPGSQVERFPGAGHFLWVEKPAEANERAVRFLKVA